MRMNTTELGELDPERIELRKRDVLGKIDEPLTHYVFIECGLVATVRAMSDDRTCTIGQIDNRGMVGVGSLFLTDRSTADYVVVLPGYGLRVQRERLRDVINRSPYLTEVFKELAHVAWAMNSQISACNRLHDFEHRFCRWLLTASNAIDADDLPVNQTEIGRLLGLTRQQVGLVTQKLAAAGLLKMVPAQHWRIRLLDKAGIEADACECYRASTRRFAQIFTNVRQKIDFSMNGATYLSRPPTP
jgi:CRP-like cAMP-binding protein